MFSQATQAVQFISQNGKDFLPTFDQQQVAYVLLQASPSNAMAQVRLPLNFCLVLDYSGSMGGDPIECVIDSVKKVIDKLEPTDYLSVVAFDDSANVIIETTQVQNAKKLKKTVDIVKSAGGGGTEMDKGMQEGLNQLRKVQRKSNMVNRMILLTDGETDNTDRCKKLAKKAKEEGIPIYPLGLGDDWNEDLLDEIGELSGGPPAEFIRIPEDAMRIFDEQVQSAMAVSVRNAVVRLNLPISVTARKVVKVLPQISDVTSTSINQRQVTVPLGDLENDRPVAVLVELLVDPRSAGPWRIGVAGLTFDVPILQAINQQITHDIKVVFTSDVNATQQVNAAIMNYAETVNAHSVVTRVLDEYKTTGRVTTKLSANVTRKLDAQTRLLVEQLTQGQSITQEDVKTIGSKTRKLTQRLDPLE